LLLNKSQALYLIKNSSPCVTEGENLEKASKIGRAESGAKGGGVLNFRARFPIPFPAISEIRQAN